MNAASPSSSFSLAGRGEHEVRPLPRTKDVPHLAVILPAAGTSARFAAEKDKLISLVKYVRSEGRRLYALYAKMADTAGLPADWFDEGRQ